ncbi:MAG: outer membrane beta-barrel protein [Candidatus Tectomicrobia bacterium]|nr:outer membrane beta-barrel protein [Candidatus Tectomicrobia bacterium]
MIPAPKTWLWTVLLAIAMGAALPAPGFTQTYVRGGVLLDRAQDTRFTDKDCESELPAALYGCGMGVDGKALSSVGDFGSMPGLEVGLGYILHPTLRLEAGIQYRPDFSFEGSSNFSGLELSDRRDVSAELSQLSGMLAAYVDIFELLLLQYVSPVGPFIGVGGGLSVIDIGDTRMDFPQTYTIVPGGSQVNFSWMVTAGIGIHLRGRTAVDIAWRYTDHGAVETPNGDGRVVWRDGSREPLPLNLGGTKGRLRSHGLNISLRYTF